MPPLPSSVCRVSARPPMCPPLPGAQAPPALVPLPGPRGLMPGFLGPPSLQHAGTSSFRGLVCVHGRGPGRWGQRYQLGNTVIEHLSLFLSLIFNRM